MFYLFFYLVELDYGETTARNTAGLEHRDPVDDLL